MTSQDFDQRVTSVVAQPEPVSREQAAAGVGVAHHAAKFHLDKLEEDGLLDVDFRRAPGRSGPGAGRPAKHYKRAAREVEVSLPERRYDLAGHVMAQAIATAEATATPIGAALSASAVEAGRSLGRQARASAGTRPSSKSLQLAVGTVLTDHGYEPRTAGDTITLANCPFHALAQDHTELVCGMNLKLIEGLLDGLGTTALQARLTPSPDRCCVTIAKT